MRTIVVFGVIAVAAAACAGGCGPIWSAAVIVDATGKFQTARTMDAKRYAPYEYYLAEEYLHKAREKESYAQYEQAVDYGKLALANAKIALDKAQQAKAGQAPGQTAYPAMQGIFGAPPAAKQPPPSAPAPVPQYTPPTPQYAPPTPQYAPPTQQYAPPTQQYAPPTQQYAPPTQQYAPPTPQYAPPPDPTPPVQQLTVPPQPTF